MKFHKITNLLGLLAKKKAAVAVVTAIVVGTGGVTGGMLAYRNAYQPESADSFAVAELDTQAMEPVEEIEEIEPETEEIVTETETEVQTIRTVGLVGSSIEKDLKIKIQDEKSNNVSGTEFAITVTKDAKGAKASTYTDSDKDGIIYINKIDAGDYVVALNDAEGFEKKEDSIKVTVKDKIEYKKVDVADEIKKESQVSGEDVTNVIPVESVLSDTVTYVESGTSSTKVSGSDVDTSSFPTAVIGKSTTTTITGNLTTASVEMRNSTRVASNSLSTESLTGTESAVNTVATEQPTETQTPSTETQKPAAVSYTCNVTHYVDGTQTSTETITKSATEGSSVTFAPSEAPSYGTYAAKYDLDSAKTTAVFTSNASTTVGNISIYWKTKQTAKTATATVTMPSSVAVYSVGGSASKSAKLSVTLSDASSIITGITWKSENTSVASVSDCSNSGATVTGVAAGSTNIVATVAYNGGKQEIKIPVTVVGSFNGSTAALKDKSGNALYTDSNCTKAATAANYSASATYYTAPQYTGWQTIDGKLYYYTSDHQKVTGTQVISGIQYNFGSDGAVVKGSQTTGIDVSSHQGNIDWATVKAAGIDFAIIRVGYRGTKTGVLVEDSYFKKNIQGATANGIKVGVYFFTQAVTEAEAVEEASMALSLVSGYSLSFPIFIDTESGSRANGLDKASRTAVVAAFCKTIANGGRTPGIYASKSWYNSNLNMSALNGYYIWVAQYATSCSYTGKYNMWQYSSKGRIAGISGNVDLDICYN